MYGLVVTSQRMSKVWIFSLVFPTNQEKKRYVKYFQYFFGEKMQYIGFRLHKASENFLNSLNTNSPLKNGPGKAQKNF